MKQIIIGCTLILGIWNNSLAQNDSNFVIPRNADYSKLTPSGIKITVSDVYSRLASLKRKVVIFDQVHKLQIGEAYIQLTSANPRENLYNKVKNDSAHFSGTLSILADGQTAFSETIVNGRVAFQITPGPVYNPHLTCTVAHVHDCVAYEVEGMSWIRYTLCLIAAPSCYVENWLECIWQVCDKHMQYTNPN
jgi:hypothetical protein